MKAAGDELAEGAVSSASTDSSPWPVRSPRAIRPRNNRASAMLSEYAYSPARVENRFPP